MKWITRSDVKVDRVACPWLIRRVVDWNAEFLFVPEEQLLDAVGRVGVRSEEAHGSTFWIRLPSIGTSDGSKT
jgi:hypothetical protein